MLLLKLAVNLTLFDSKKNNLLIFHLIYKFTEGRILNVVIDMSNLSGTNERFPKMPQQYCGGQGKELVL